MTFSLVCVLTKNERANLFWDEGGKRICFYVFLSFGAKPVTEEAAELIYNSPRGLYLYGGPGAKKKLA